MTSFSLILKNDKHPFLNRPCFVFVFVLSFYSSSLSKCRINICSWNRESYCIRNDMKMDTVIIFTSWVMNSYETHSPKFSIKYRLGFVSVFFLHSTESITWGSPRRCALSKIFRSHTITCYVIDTTLDHKLGDIRGKQYFPKSERYLRRATTTILIFDNVVSVNDVLSKTPVKVLRDAFMIETTCCPPLITVDTISRLRHDHISLSLHYSIVTRICFSQSRQESDPIKTSNSTSTVSRIAHEKIVDETRRIASENILSTYVQKIMRQTSDRSDVEKSREHRIWKSYLWLNRCSSEIPKHYNLEISTIPE